MEVGEGLRLDPLRRVDQEDRPFTGGQASRHLVREVDVPGRVDEVQLVLDAARSVGQANGLRFDGDAPFTLELHSVQVLLAHLPCRHRVRDLEEAVGQRRLPVVDVRHDAEVADE